MMMGPVPGMFEKLLAGEIGFLDTLGGQLGNHLSLGGDGSMVGAGHPAGILALHARTTDKDILNGLVEHVPHVENSGYIGGRDNNGVGFAAVRPGAEEFMLHPVGIPLVFNLCGVVFGG